MEEKKLNEEIVNSLVDIGHLVREEILNITSKLSDLTLLQIQLLIYIYHHKQVRNTEIATAFHTKKSTTSFHLRRLEELKLIKRQSDIKDRRNEQISLTAKGLRIIDKRVKERNSHTNRILKYIPVNDRKKLLNTLSEIKQVFLKKYEKGNNEK